METRVKGAVSNAEYLKIIDVGGTIREAGIDLGRQLKDMLAEMVEQLRRRVEPWFPGGWEMFQKRARIYQAYVENFLANDHEEMTGIAEGSGLAIDALYCLTCLELREELKGCSDFLLGKPSTVNGHVLACHNEDWAVNEQPFLVVRRSQIEGEPKTISIAYGGIIPSIGFNDQGLSLTGNALSPNDKHFGIPKLHIVREIIRTKTLAEALRLCALTPRASSFNNALATRDGQLYNFEGSATDNDIAFSTEYSVHTNHYTYDRMKRYEEDPIGCIGSVLRLNTVTELVKSNLGRLSVDACREILSSHVNSPDAPCRHSPNDDAGCTVFSAIIDLTDLVMHASIGNPCTSSWARYTFK